MIFLTAPFVMETDMLYYLIHWLKIIHIILGGPSSQNFKDFRVSRQFLLLYHSCLEMSHFVGNEKNRYKVEICCLKQDIRKYIKGRPFLNPFIIWLSNISSCFSSMSLTGKRLMDFSKFLGWFSVHFLTFLYIHAASRLLYFKIG